MLRRGAKVPWLDGTGEPLLIYFAWWVCLACLPLFRTVFYSQLVITAVVEASQGVHVELRFFLLMAPPPSLTSSRWALFAESAFIKGRQIFGEDFPPQNNSQGDRDSSLPRL